MQITIDGDGQRADVTGTRAPLPGLRSAAPIVSVIGQYNRVAGLERHLPSGWIMRRRRSLDEVVPDDLVLLSGATRQDVEAARALLPRRARVVALLDDGAPPDTVAAVLTAGADACVRDGHPAILAGHLVACRRRQTAERWSAHPLMADSGRPVAV